MQAIQLGPTPVDAAIDRAHLFLRESEGDRLLTASILSSLAVLLAMRGEFGEARAQWARAQALWDELGMAHHRAIRAIDASTIELLAGDAEAAERELRTGYDMLVEIGDVHLRPTLAAYLAAVLVEKGDLGDAEAACVLRGVPLLGRRHRHGSDVARRTRADRGTQGEAAEAERLAREAVGLAAPTDFLDLQATALLALARVLRRGEVRRRPRASPPRRRRSTSARGTSSARSWAALLPRQSADAWSRVSARGREEMRHERL